MSRVRHVVAATILLTIAAPAAATPAAPQFADELTVWALPAPRPAELSWTTPGGLIRRVVTNSVGGMLQIMDRTLGHMGVTLRCSAQPGIPASAWQGSMIGAIKSEFTDIVVKQAYGLGVLFHNFTGRIEAAEELQASLDERLPAPAQDNVTNLKMGRVAWLRYGISPSTCQRLRGWVAAFASSPASKFYGLAAAPRLREGAGCSALSMSFIEQAGLLEPALKPWSFNLGVPMSLIGGTLTGTRVPLSRAIALTRGWATPSEPQKPIFGWDPTQAFYWIKQMAPAIMHGARVFSGPAVVEQRGHSVGIVLDRRRVPTPTEPYFKN